MVCSTLWRFFSGIDVTVNLHGVPVSGHVPSNCSIVYATVYYSKHNTVVQYHREYRGNGQRRRPFSFYKIRNKQHCAASARDDQHWFMERQTQSQRVTDHLIHANHLRSTPTHATVQAQTQREGLGYCWWYNSAVQHGTCQHNRVS